MSVSNLPARSTWRFAPNPYLNRSDEVANREAGDGINENSVVPSHIYPPDVVLLRQGYKAEQVYFIEEGLVKLNRLEPDGKQTIVGLRSSGWVLGTSAAILQENCQVTATTLTSCGIRHISAGAFRHLLKTDVQFSWNIQYSQSRETDEQIGRITQLSCHSARQRLEQLLWTLSATLATDQPTSSVKIKVPLRQWEIAQLTDVSPEHLCRMFKEVEEAGIIKRSKGWLIVQTEKLWHSSGSVARGR
jgi:CRP/FNR family transcriptional regulator